LELDAYTGAKTQAVSFITELTPDTVARFTDELGFGAVGDFWVHPLRPPAGGATLGLLAVEDPQRPLNADEQVILDGLVKAAERALEDRVVQERVLTALRDLEPELEGLQRLRGALEVGEPSLAAITTSPVFAPDFPHWVRDALHHYWGGPKLTESPLMGLNIVREALAAHDNNPANAMRAVLDSALERLKPEGDRSHTAYEWLAYNILELKFIRGLRVRDIASRLALSESDLYRKQRVAVEALAQQLVAMEADRAAGERLARRPG
jgi:hypothetical protein